jgi:hypothetical protein
MSQRKICLCASVRAQSSAGGAAQLHAAFHIRLVLLVMWRVDLASCGRAVGVLNGMLLGFGSHNSDPTARVLPVLLSHSTSFRVPAMMRALPTLTSDQGCYSREMHDPKNVSNTDTMLQSHLSNFWSIMM